MGADFLGIGWAFPVRVDVDGAIAARHYEDSIKESIQIILGTAKGERQMRSDFGCGIHELVFARNNTATAGMAAYHVEQALIRWEPRIELLKVEAFPDRETKGGAPVPSERLIIAVEYRVIATNSIFNLVYPFYLTEGAGA
jgi:phage baseplate assembly protein W